MSDQSPIEWTQATWNPVTGCSKVSPGCAHGYAETFAERFRGTPGHHFEQGFDLRLWPERLELPLRWRKPKLIFVNSMSDLSHPEIPEWFLARVWDTMTQARWHTFQVLTKRPERMPRLLRQLRLQNPPLPNVWIENRRFVHRAEHLRHTPAVVRFVSAEPLLGPLDELDLTGIDWLIAGGAALHAMDRTLIAGGHSAVIGGELDLLCVALEVAQRQALREEAAVADEFLTVGQAYRPTGIRRANHDRERGHRRPRERRIPPLISIAPPTDAMHTPTETARTPPTPSVRRSQAAPRRSAHRTQPPSRAHRRRPSAEGHGWSIAAQGGARPVSATEPSALRLRQTASARTS